MVSYITGAILPIVSLCMTSMVVNAAGLEKIEDEPEKIIEDKHIDNQQINEESKIFY
jgi:hypothetical protein